MKILWYALLSGATITRATPCVEVWQTSNLPPLRLGEEKKIEERRKKETTGQKYNGPPIT